MACTKGRMPAACCFTRTNLNDPARHNAKPRKPPRLLPPPHSFPACTRRVNGTHTGPTRRNEQNESGAPTSGPCMDARIVLSHVVQYSKYVKGDSARGKFFFFRCHVLARSLVYQHARAVSSGHTVHHIVECKQQQS